MILHQTPVRFALQFALLLLSSTWLGGGAVAQGTCVVRNGSGVNPSGFACAGDAVVGLPWNTTVNITSPPAALSAVTVFLGGPLPGLPLSFGELLCNPPMTLTDLSNGAHSIPIPNQPHLVGQKFCAQAASITLGPLRLQLQNAIDVTIAGTAVGLENITVHVFIDTGIDGAKLTNGDSAQVTLVGTDPSSINGRVATTNSGGLATFFGVSGPYTVTAQRNSTVQGLTTRNAGSVLDIVPATLGSPPAGTIGVLVFEDSERSLPTNATLTGTVSNMPAFSGNEHLLISFRSNGAEGFETAVWPNQSTGAYSVSIPSGVQIDCVVTHREDFNLWSSPVLASLIMPSVGSAMPGGTIVQNFDFASGAVVPWNNIVSLSTTNKHPALSIGFQLWLVNPLTGESYDLSFFDGPNAPATIRLPDVTDPKFAPYRIEFEADTFDPNWVIQEEQNYSQFLGTTPSSISVDFYLFPTIQSPADLAIIPFAQFQSLNVQIMEAPTGSIVNNGFNLFLIDTESGSGGTPPAGIDQASWAIFVQKGTTEFDLPPYDLPMFGSDQVVYCELDQIRFEGYNFAYNSFFDSNLSANFDALRKLTKFYESLTPITVFLVP